MAAKPKSKDDKMPQLTVRQARLVKILTDPNDKSKTRKEQLLKAGYSESVANTLPATIIGKSKVAKAVEIQTRRQMDSAREFSNKSAELIADGADGIQVNGTDREKVEAGIGLGKYALELKKATAGQEDVDLEKERLRRRDHIRKAIAVGARLAARYGTAAIVSRFLPPQDVVVPMVHNQEMKEKVGISTNDS